MSAPSWNFVAISFYVYMAAFVLVERVLTRSSLGSKERGDRDPLTVSFFILPAVGIFLWMSLLHRGFPPHPTWALYGAGIVIGILGMTIRVIGKRTLGQFFTVRVQLQEDHRIIDQGIYAKVRHPLYAGFILEWMAPPLILGSPIGFLFTTLPITIALLARIPREEALLTEAFGERYREYMRRTKRLIPGVW
jgi:protein-S-isoprenylcysteine O-methyltransferase Ste14